jgi:hypothetical protein
MACTATHSTVASFRAIAALAILRPRRVEQPLKLETAKANSVLAVQQTEFDLPMLL